eukprot:352103-Chlamydomonas_euryale.AAC.11
MGVEGSELFGRTFIGPVREGGRRAGEVREGGGMDEGVRTIQRPPFSAPPARATTVDRWRIHACVHDCAPCAHRSRPHPRSPHVQQQAHARRDSHTCARLHPPHHTHTHTHMREGANRFVCAHTGTDPSNLNPFPEFHCNCHCYTGFSGRKIFCRKITTITTSTITHYKEHHYPLQRAP